MITLKKFKNKLANETNFYKLGQDDSVLLHKYYTEDFKTHFGKTRVLLEEMKNGFSNFKGTNDSGINLLNKIKVINYDTFGYSEPKVTEKFIFKPSVQLSDTTKASKDLQKLPQNPEVTSVENFFDNDGVPDDSSGIVESLHLVAEIPQRIEPALIYQVLHLIPVLCLFPLAAILYAKYVKIGFGISFIKNYIMSGEKYRVFLRENKNIISTLFFWTGSFYFGYYNGVRDCIKFHELEKFSKLTLLNVMKVNSFFVILIISLLKTLFLPLEVFFRVFFFVFQKKYQFLIFLSLIFFFLV